MAENINRPNLLIVGAAKSGTTSLHNYLKQHPEIFMTEHKEPHFLINSEIGQKRVHKGVTELEKYEQMFLTDINYKYKGESSVMYLAFPEFSIKNIKKYLSSDVKIIIMLRNPVERAYAGYLHNLRYNPSENLTFKQAIKECEDRYQKDKEITPDTRYLHVGNYYSQVKAFIDEFKLNTHIIFYDDYVKDIDYCLEKLFVFLEVKDVKIDTSTRHMQGGWMFKNKYLRNLLIPKNNIKSIFKLLIPFQKIRSLLKNKIMAFSTTSTPEFTKEMRKKLISYYHNDIVKLSKLLNTKLDHWINEN